MLLAVMQTDSYVATHDKINYEIFYKLNVYVAIYVHTHVHTYIATYRGVSSVVSNHEYVYNLAI